MRLEHFEALEGGGRHAGPAAEMEPEEAAREQVAQWIDRNLWGEVGRFAHRSTRWMLPWRYETMPRASNGQRLKSGMAS